MTTTFLYSCYNKADDSYSFHSQQKKGLEGV